jgi:hypothetical protein
VQKLKVHDPYITSLLAFPERRGYKNTRHLQNASASGKIAIVLTIG